MTSIRTDSATRNQSGENGNIIHLLRMTMAMMLMLRSLRTDRVFQEESHKQLG